MNPPLALVIEDHWLLAKVFSDVLSQAGYETVLIYDGRAALDYLEENVPYLILLDLHLPFIQGMEILRWVRSQERFANSLVFVVTADEALTRNPEIEKLATNVFQKPVRFPQLQALAEKNFPSK